VAYEQRVNPLCFLSPSNFNITGNCFSRQPPAVDNMVSRDVVYLRSEKRNKRVGFATRIGLRQLPHGLDVFT